MTTEPPINCKAPDLAARRRAERILEESDRGFKAVFETTLDAIFILDDGGKVEALNPAAATLLGLAPDLVCGRPLLDLARPSREEDYRRIWELLIREGAYQGELDCENGGMLDVRAVARFLPGHHLCVLRDISERKRGEELLRKERELLETVTKQVGVGIAIISPDFKTVWANRVLHDIYGEEVDGKACHSTYNRREVICPQCGVAQVFRGKEQAFHEQRGFDRQGNEVWAQIIATPLRNPAGQVMGAVEVVVPITERRKAESALRESEEKFRLSSRAALDAIIMVDDEGRVTAWNPAATRILGYTEEESLGKDLHALLAPPRFLEAYRTGFRRWRTTGSGEMIGKIQSLAAIRKDGTEIIVEVSLSALKLADRWHAIGILRDVTERRTLELQLRQAQKLESIGQLAAGIAHEINTPIQYIGDNANFLQSAFHDLQAVLATYQKLLAAGQGTLPAALVAEAEAVARAADLAYLEEEIPKAIGQSLEGVSRVATIVRAMKEFSHPGGEEKKAVDLNRAILNTITVAKNEWKYAAEVATDLDPSLPPVSCLPGEINQVVLNLLINAAHAIADVVGREGTRKGTIAVSTRAEGGMAEIRVSDTGTGIPAACRGHIFEPFFTTKPVGKGTGQGLSIAYQVVVKKHGGTISFDTVMGKGTTFIVRIPLEPQGGPAAEEGASPTPSPASGGEGEASI